MILLSVVAILLLVDLAFFIKDQYIASFFGLVSIVAGAWYFIPDVAVLIQTFGLLPILAGYVGVGIGVATIKWFATNFIHWLRLREARSDFQDKYAKTDGDTPASREYAFAKFWNNNFYQRGKLYPRVTEHAESFECDSNFLVNELTLRARDHIERISFWVLQWPIVIVATALEDLLINIGRNVARFFDWAFTQFSRRLVASTVKDL